MGTDIQYNNMNFPDRQRLKFARTLRVVAVVVVARLARCAWWLWLGLHAARPQR